MKRTMREGKRLEVSLMKFASELLGSSDATGVPPQGVCTWPCARGFPRGRSSKLLCQESLAPSSINHKQMLR